MIEGAYSSSQSDNSKKPANLMDFDEAKTTICKLVGVMDEQEQCVLNNRHLRYAEIDIEAERKAGKLAPDELYIPQHLIDMNIRREQALYVSYIVGSTRASVLTNTDDPTMDSALIERDFTMRRRYDGWQTPMFRMIDGMQMNGYSVLEVVRDNTKPGHLSVQEVAYGDFGYSLDTKDIQSVECLVRRYYFTKTQLLALAREDTWKFDKSQVEKIVCIKDSETNDYKEQSLYKIEKVMFRKQGIVMQAWSCQLRCDKWLRAPKALYLGRQEFDMASNQYIKTFETRYPYVVIPYTITENTVIRQLKGRAYLDQDAQEGVSSLMSSFVTAHRRAAYLVFSKDSENDPNADVITQSNIAFKPGAVINAKVKQFQLTPPDPAMLGSIQALASANAQENSQINYAAQNRTDSRKTAEEIKASGASAQQLSQIQLALFSSACRTVDKEFFDIIRSRILAGLIKVSQPMMELYIYNYAVKPAGDVDVVEKQQKIQTMMQTWPVISQTGCAQTFLNKLIVLLFPDDASVYIDEMQQQQKEKQLLTACGQVLTALVQDKQALSPHEQQNIPQIQQLLQAIQQTLGTGQQKQARGQQQQQKQLTNGGPQQ